MKLNIVMVEPEIPQNTGNIARTCAITGAKLHLVHPLGFSLNEKALKRAGLDYWDKLDIEEHSSLEEFLNNKFPKSVIRSKGIVWFSDENEASYVLEQAGKQIQASDAGLWVATAPEVEKQQIIRESPEILEDWDEKYGDRMIKLVFIGRNMDKEQIIKDLDSCLVKDFEF